MLARVLSWKNLETRSTDRSEELTIYVLAPIGRDASLVEEALRRGGINARSVPDVDALCEGLAAGAGAAIISEEALREPVVERIGRILSQQPAWSDLPLLILTIAQDGTWRDGSNSRFSDSLGNFSLLERPIRLETLVRAVTTALRARQRQYEIRDHLEERRRAEAALQKSEARHRGLVTASSAILWSSDANGGFVEPQESWEDYTGQSWDEYQQDGWLKAVHVDDRQSLLNGWAEARKEQRVFQAEARLWHRHSKDHRHSEFRAVPMFESVGVIHEWVGLVADTEERKKAEAALRRSEKLASAGRLAATIAHEINNPLEAVTNLLFLIKSDVELSGTSRKFLELMEHELNRVVHITKQTLAFYRDSTSPALISLREMTDGLMTIYGKRMQSKNLNVQIECPSEVQVMTNPGELRQVFSNLLSNALDAVGERGHIRVRARCVEHDGRSGLRLTIADNGTGISEADQRRIFEPFFTTKATIGTGLGLWVCKDLIDKNGGTILFRSCVSPGKSGTVFSVFLPNHLGNSRPTPAN